MKNLAVYLKNYIKECILAPLFKLLEASFALTVPFSMASIIDSGIESGDTAYIIRMGLLLVLLAAVGFGSACAAQYPSASSAAAMLTPPFSAVSRSMRKARLQTG